MMNTPQFRSPHVLYVSYDGLLEPLGESQVLGYLERLARDYEITVMSFEKSEDLGDGVRVAAMERRLAACRIVWIRLRYHRHPPVVSTAFDAIAGISRARAACRRCAVTLVHARGYVPSLIAMGARRASAAGFLFDMRGFWVDEKVEAGHWRPGGLLYRIGKWWERRFFGAADAIVSLTEAGVRAFPELGHDAGRAVIEVIPTCVDLERFTPGTKDPELRERLGLGDGPVFGCVGTMSNWYLRADMLAYLVRLTRAFHRASVLIVTRDDHDRLRSDAKRAGLAEGRLVLARANFADMPQFIRLLNAGLFFIRPTLSKRGSTATKLAEFLACGVPVIINDGVGDSGTIVKQGRVGVVLPDLDPRLAEQSLSQVESLLDDPTVPTRCRQVATEYFDLDRGAEKYRQLYARLIGRGTGCRAPE